MIDLTARSIEIIKAGQATSGAYVACPTFSQYGYSWLRDGTWIAYAMDCVGQTSSAERFYRWVAATILSHSEQVERLLDKLNQGQTLQESDYLPTRFRLDGQKDDKPWENFQLDGYGTWLWGLAQHIKKSDNASLWAEVLPAVRLSIRYLAALWHSPNYDCWEEHRQEIHPATLAAIYGGLAAVQKLDASLLSAELLSEIQTFSQTKAITNDGTIMKYFGNEAVDASLLWCALPYGLFDLHSAVFMGTLAKIERDLHYRDLHSNQVGGVYRYLADTYYGGGEWLLLAAWLGWVYVALGRLDEAQSILVWIESQANMAGEMPEQTADHLLHPERHAEWEARWGTSASPLLWSHAMYLILKTNLKSETGHAHS